MDRRVDFGTYVTQARQAAGLSKAELARAAGVDASTITKLEAGGMGVSGPLVFTLSTVLGVPPPALADVAGLAEIAEHWRAWAARQPGDPATPSGRLRAALAEMPLRPVARGAITRLVDELLRDEPSSDVVERIQRAMADSRDAIKEVAAEDGKPFEPDEILDLYESVLRRKLAGD